MSASITNRVILPDGNKIYCSDDLYGDVRINELHKKFGNLKIEACNKIFGKSLDEAEAFWTGTIEEYFS